MPANLPSRGLQLQSTLTEDGTLRLALAEVAVLPPEADQIVVRVEAAPINPSDLMPLFASADPNAARFVGGAVELSVTPAEAARRSGRIGQPLPIGLGGAGTAVATGKDAEHLLGQPVAFLSLSAGSFAQYVTVTSAECAVLPDGVSASEGADVFCNPMTALAMTEQVRLEGGNALIHTAAASNVGQMLVRICREDGMGLVNVVRRQEQVDLLKAIGAEHVCNSSAASFADDLRAAIAATGATIAFDAIGGGTSVATLHRAMEDVAAAQLGFYSPYGSPTPKQVFIYGHLDPAPLVLHGDEYGMDWSVRQWAMPQTLARVGPERAGAMQQRILARLKTTFASSYGREISLAQTLDREVMTDYAKLGTGAKYLINPTL